MNQGNTMGYHTQIIIQRMIIQQTGTYNQMYRRSYHSEMTGDAINDLTRRIDQITHGDLSNNITSNMVAGLSHGLFIPKASVDNNDLVNIQNGWQETRLRFLMEVMVNQSIGQSIYYFQGYTDHPGVTLTGQIDPRMPFFINSFLRVSRSVDPATQRFRDIVTDTAQVINGQIMVQSFNPQLYTMRPEDLFTGIQSNYMQQSYNALNGQSMTETRLNKASESLRSDRTYGIPSAFLATSLDNYRTALQLSEYGQDGRDILQHAATIDYEPMLSENPFIRAIANMRGVMTTTYFTLGELEALDSTVSSRIHYNPLDPSATIHRTGQTEHWHGSNYETQAATILISSVSSLMMQSMITSMVLTSTNHSISGQIVTEVGESYTSITNADMRPMINRLIQRFEMEVLPDVTHGNQVSYWLQIVADLLGETRVKISLNGQPLVEFAAPSFCDAITAPILTNNQNEFNNVVHGIEVLTNTVMNNRAPDLHAYSSGIDTNI